MIPIKNIYYMLSYAFQVLNEQGYKDLETEQFDNFADLCSAILIKGVSLQLKQGLNHEYISFTQNISTLRGKVDITESINNRSELKHQIVCTFDEFSENSYMNRIIKSTLFLLLKANISENRKKEIHRLLHYFHGISTLNIKNINWRFRFNRNNRSYQLILSMCYLAINGLIHTQTDGTTKLMDFLDEQNMCRLFEKFILEYYRKEHKDITANASHIEWQLDNEHNDMLPQMKTDVTLSKDKHIIIIDAKYYSKNTQTQYGTHTVYSNNLYQIFTYVKNKEYEYRNTPHKVSGILLYAQTDENIQPEQEYSMSGNQMVVSTLNLNCNFDEIKQKLDYIKQRYI